MSIPCQALNVTKIDKLLMRCAATMYGLTKRLCAVLSVPLTLDTSLAPSLKRGHARDPTTHKFDTAAPEVSFLAVGLMVLKMTAGLDHRRR